MKIRVGIVMIGYLLASPVLAATPNNSNWTPHKPYIGIEGHARYINLDPRFGQHLFKRILPQLGIYGGFLFNDYVGLEMGYETTFSRTQERTLSAGQFFPGCQLPLNFYEIYDVRQYVDSATLGVMGYLPINEDNWLFGSIGVSFTKISTAATFLRSEMTNTPDGMTIFENSRNYKKEKLIPFFKAGIQHKITEATTLRFFVDWKNTDRFRIKSTQFPSGSSQLRYQNSLAYGIGLIFFW